MKSNNSNKPNDSAIKKNICCQKDELIDIKIYSDLTVKQ